MYCTFIKTKYFFFIFFRLTLSLLTWRIWWVSNNDSRWQMGFNSTFKVLTNFWINILHAGGLCLRRLSGKYKGRINRVYFYSSSFTSYSIHLVLSSFPIPFFYAVSLPNTIPVSTPCDGAEPPEHCMVDSASMLNTPISFTFPVRFFGLKWV